MPTAQETGYRKAHHSEQKVTGMSFTNRCLSENTPNRILPHNPWNIHARFLHKAGRIYNTYARELYFFHEGTIDLRRRIYRCNAKDL